MSGALPLKRRLCKTQTRDYFCLSYNDKEACLTRREMEVLKILILNIKGKQAADRLNISVNTFNCHMSSIREKIGCKSLFELGLAISPYKKEIEKNF